MTTRKNGSKNRAARGQSSWARRLVRGVLFALLLVIVAALSTLAGLYVGVARSLPPLDAAAQLKTAQTTKIYDDSPTPNLIAELHGVENRDVLTADEIPQRMRDAVVAIEDQRYYTHGGVDFLGILRALWENMLHREIVQGGSTITQEFIKNAYLTKDQTLDRKLREAAMAYQLEKQWSKEKILNEYLNIVYFGEGAYGIQAAARSYFGVDAKNLSVAQAGLLAGLLKGPSNYDPRRDPEAALTRRDLVLNKMFQQKYITSAELQDALASPLKLAPSNGGDNQKVPYWVEMVRQQLVARYGSSMVLNGGLRAYISVDLKQQSQAEKAVSSVLNKSGDPSAALVSIDLHTGRLVAMVGGQDFTQQQFNLATQGRRQPGSAFKPFVLVTALKQGLSPETTYDSGSVTIDLTGGSWPVKSTDQGKLTLTEATAQSSNGVYARLIMDVGPAAVASTAKTMGVVTSLGDPPNAAIALGGLKTGVSPLEMAMAYATLATGGRRLSASMVFDPSESGYPVTIIRVTDSSGKVLDENKPVWTQAIDPGLAALTTTVLEKVITEGTGTAAAIGRPAAGKTGTTSDYRDAWFVGYTPDMVTAVWVGYPNEQKAMTDVHGIAVTGGSLPAKIWAAYMKEALSGSPVTDFSQPASADRYVTVDVCSESHLLPTEYCPTVVPMLFRAGQEPAALCAIHKPKDAPVPDVSGKSLDAARSLLEKAGFKVTTTQDPQSAEPAGTVVQQTPTAGSLLTQGQAVALVVSSAVPVPQTATVPNFQGLDVAAARLLADQLGLALNESTETGPDPTGTVVSQDPAPGTAVAEGATIDVVVSSGPAAAP